MLKPLTAALMLVIVMSGCENKTSHKYQLHTVGIVQDVNVVPTSANESIKTQIKCDSLFFVVKGLPTIKIGAKLKGGYDINGLVEIYDVNGNEYQVFN